MSKHTECVLAFALLILTASAWPTLAVPDKIRTAVAVLRAADGSSGSGFLLHQGGKIWLMTNAHVVNRAELTDARTIEGQRLELAAMQVASDRDLARFQVLGIPPKHALRLAKSVREGEAIYAYGNSHGKGTVPELPGKVVAEGPMRLEIDAEIVTGNSGGPVLNAQGDVVGVATELACHLVPQGEIDWAQGTRFTEIRRFALRMDRDIKWLSVNKREYYAQAAYLHDVHVFIQEMCPALVHYYSKLQQPLSYATARQPGGYRYRTLHGRMKDFYEAYGRFLATLMAVQESYDSLKGRYNVSEQFQRDEERRVRNARQRREVRVNELHAKATSLCQEPLQRLSQASWETPQQEKEAEQLIETLTKLDGWLSRLAADAIQRKTWE